MIFNYPEYPLLSGVLQICQSVLCNSALKKAFPLINSPKILDLCHKKDLDFAGKAIFMGLYWKGCCCCIVVLPVLGAHTFASN